MTNKFDWDRIRAELKELSRPQEPSEAEVRRTLERRARALSRQSDDDDVANVQLLRFHLAGEEYGIEARWVLEVLRNPQIATVKGGPPFMHGLTPWRGNLIPVFDVRAILGRSPVTERLDTLIVLAGASNEPEFAIRVQQVHEVAEVPEQLLIPVPDSLPNAARRFLVATTHDGLVVLDGRALVADNDLVVE